MDNWYVLRAMTGKEAEIAIMLRRNGIQAIAPDVRRLERKDGEWRTLSRRAFPGYVFIRCVMTIPLYYHLMNKPGVIALLGMAGQRWTEIPDEQAQWIETLNEAYARKADEPSKAKADENGKAEIVSGPLLGMKDRIVKIDLRRRRATVAIELYDETYEIDAAIEPIDDKHTESPAG